VLAVALKAQKQPLPRAVNVFDVKLAYNTAGVDGKSEPRTVEAKVKARFVKPGMESKKGKAQKEWLLSGRIYGDDDGADAPHYVVEVITGDSSPPRRVFVGTEAQRKEVDLAILRRLMSVELPGLEPVDPAVLDLLESFPRRRA
jgi:hypothetical protein